MRIQPIMIPVAAISVAGLTLFGLYERADRETPANQSPEHTAPVLVQGFGEAMSPEMLVYRSSAAIRGVIVSVSEPRWSTHDGDPPQGWVPGEVLPGLEVVYRVVNVEVAETLFGEVGSVVSVAVLGGGDESLIEVTDLIVPPSLRAGDEVLLFTVEPAPGWRLGVENQGLLQGYKVAGDSLFAGTESSSLSFSDTRARVESELNRKAGGALEPLSR